jgi:protein-tyrosine phosphatase
MIREVYSPLLFIGNALDARDLRLLHEHNIVAVLDLALNEPPAQLGRELLSFRVPLVDSSGNSNSQIATAIQSLALLLNSEYRTLVACSAGMSRAPAIVAAALALHTSSDLNHCLAKVVNGHPHDVSPALWQDVAEVFSQLRNKK